MDELELLNWPRYKSKSLAFSHSSRGTTSHHPYKLKLPLIGVNLCGNCHFPLLLAQPW